MNIQETKALYDAVKHARFCDISLIDLQDRLALLTVPAGLRQVAAFGFGETNNEGRLRTVRDILVNHGLLTLLTRELRLPAAKVWEEIPTEIAEVFNRVDEDADRKRSGKLLWVLTDTQEREMIRASVRGEAEIGILLQYPTCCVQKQRERHRDCKEAFVTAIVEAVGKDPKAIERALREDKEVEIPACAVDTEDVARTSRRFPFIFHVACESCLVSDSSPSAEQNRIYERLAQQLDPEFHKAILKIAAIESDIFAVIHDAEQKDLKPGELDPASNQRLQSLFQAIDEIHDRLLS